MYWVKVVRQSDDSHNGINERVYRSLRMKIWQVNRGIVLDSLVRASKPRAIKSALGPP